MQNNKIYDAFDLVRASESQKKNARKRIREIINEPEKAAGDSSFHAFSHASSGFSGQRSGRKYRPYAFAAAAALLVMVLCLGNYHIQTVAAAYVSIDVNPSIELTLNRSNHVVRADACNDDGQSVLDTLKLKGKSCTDAVDLIVDCDAMQPYLTDNSALTFTVMSDDSDRCSELEDLLEGCQANYAVSGTVCQASSDIYEEAHEHGLSFGKYQLYLELCKYDDSITAEDCHDMTMEEMENEIHCHEESDCQDSTECHDGSDCPDSSECHDGSGCQDSSECHDGSGCQDSSESHGGSDCQDSSEKFGTSSEDCSTSSGSSCDSDESHESEHHHESHD